GIANIDEALQPFFTTCRNGERSGMGFTVMQAFCDKMEVDSEVDRGTIVTLIKTIGNGKGEEC
ncbi:MAG: anti-sigma F factor, partial [Clostridia bacterium]